MQALVSPRVLTAGAMPRLDAAQLACTWCRAPTPLPQTHAVHVGRLAGMPIAGLAFPVLTECLMKTTWTLVADEAIARILELPPEAGDLMPVEELTDPGAHAREGEMHHAPHGRRASGGAAAQATVSASESERHQHAQDFAARIAERLTQCQREGRFAALHIMAAPRMLGYLRKALDANVSAVVASELNKDVVHESLADLTRRLPGRLASRLEG